MKTRILFISTLFLFIVTLSFSQTFTWVKQMGGSGFDNANSFAFDTAGNIFVGGSFQGTADFNPGLGTYTLSANAGDAYITKLDKDGNFIWAVGFGAAGGESVESVTTDEAGNVYATGTFQNTVDFEPGSGTTNLVAGGTSSDIFVLKLDPNGVFGWAKSFGAVAQDYVNAIVSDKTGNTFISGNFYGTVDFYVGATGSSLTSPNSSDDVYILKLDALGAFVWVKQLGGTGAEKTFSSYMDYTGNLYLTGSFSSTNADFDPGSGTANFNGNGGDAFVSKFSNNGVYIWTKQFVGSFINDERGTGITVDSDKNVYTTGAFGGYLETDFDPNAGVYNLTALKAAGGTATGTDIFVSKLDSNGNFVYARQFGCKGTTLPKAVAVDAFHNLYAMGTFLDSVAFDGSSAYTHGPLSNGGAGLDIYIVKIDNNGNYDWTRQFGGGTVGAIGASIYVNNNFDIYSAGTFQGIVDFDPNAGSSTLTSFGVAANDAFVHKISQCISPPAPLNVTAASNLTICPGSTATLSASGTSGNISWYSASTLGTYLGGGNSYTTSTLSTNATFYAQDSLCAASPRTAITVTVGLPSIAVTASNDSICKGATVLLSASGSGSSYSWNSGASSASINVSPTLTTTYTVTTSNGSCSNLTTIEITVLGCTVGMEILDLNSGVTLYPNPVKDYLSVNFSEEVDAEISLTDITGKNIFTVLHSGKMFETNLNDLSNGVYYVTIKNDTGVINKKIILNK